MPDVVSSALTACHGTKCVSKNATASASEAPGAIARAAAHAAFHGSCFSRTVQLRTKGSIDGRRLSRRQSVRSCQAAAARRPRYSGSGGGGGTGVGGAGGGGHTG